MPPRKPFNKNSKFFKVAEDLAIRNIIPRSSVYNVAGKKRKVDNLKKVSAILEKLDSYKAFDIDRIVEFLRSPRIENCKNVVGYISYEALMREIINDPNIYKEPAEEQLREKIRKETPAYFKSLVNLLNRNIKVRQLRKKHALPLWMKIEFEQQEKHIRDIMKYG